MILFLALLIGVVAGLRAMMAPAVVSWLSAKGILNLEGHWLAFLGYRWTPWILTVAAAGELVSDQLPSTPSRKVPPQFGARIVMGAVAGATLAMPSQQGFEGALLGIVGAVAGTFGGAAFRNRLATFFRNDHPAALIEDVLALALSAAVALMI